MMVDCDQVVEIDNKSVLETFFRADGTALHLYELGDLDEFFWPLTKWHGYREACDEQFSFVLLFYDTGAFPVLLAIGNNIEQGKKLLKGLISSNLMPHKFYSHLSPGISTTLNNAFMANNCRKLYKMQLTDCTIAATVNTEHVVKLGVADAERIKVFYDVSYPENWFDARMLETEQIHAVLADDASVILAIAGIHVYTTTYRITAIGNVAVHPNHRGKGLARTVTAALINSVCRVGVEHIGLNVLQSNVAAIKCYQRLGFSVIAEYEEAMWHKQETHSTTSNEV